MGYIIFSFYSLPVSLQPSWSHVCLCVIEWVWSSLSFLKIWKCNLGLKVCRAGFSLGECKWVVLLVVKVSALSEHYFQPEMLQVSNCVTHHLLPPRACLRKKLWLGVATNTWTWVLQFRSLNSVSKKDFSSTLIAHRYKQIWLKMYFCIQFSGGLPLSQLIWMLLTKHTPKKINHHDKQI